MLLSFDRTGFPLVAIPGVGYIHLFPITRVQFALCDAVQAAYKMACTTVKHAASYVDDENLLERHFMTGVLPSEAELFCEWLSEHDKGTYRVPESMEWPGLFGHILDQKIDQMMLFDQCKELAVRTLIERIIEERHPVTYLDLCLRQEGVVEWVRTQEGWAGRGQPRHAFSGGAFEDPQNREIQPVASYLERRSFLFGFRPVRPF